MELLGIFAKWVFGKALAAGGSALVRVVFPDDLQARLEAVAEAWRATLPAEASLLEVRAALATAYPSLPDNPAPEPTEVVQKLEVLQTPTEDDWHAALMRHWRWVRSLDAERQDFFRIDEALADKLLRDLAERLAQVGRKDRELFQGQSLHDHSVMLNKLELVHTLVERDKGTPGSRFHSQIDAAVEYTKKGQPDVAIAQLEALRRTDWDRLDDRERYRVLANLGHAHDAKSDDENAAKCFIGCKQFQPADEMARSLEAIGYSMLSDRPRARLLADQLLSDCPTCDLACATRIRNEPIEKLFDEIEADVPAALKDSVETRFSLSIRALISNNLEKAQQYARLVYEAEKDSPVAAEQLAIVLLNVAKREAIQQYVHPPRLSSTVLDEAKTLLDHAKRKTLQSNQSAMARIRFMQGIRCMLDGDQVSAEGHFHAAYDFDPEDSDYARHHALLQHDFGRHDEAIDILSKGTATDTSGRGTVLLGAFLLGRNRPGDADTAIKHAENLLTRSTLDALTRMECVSLLVEAHGIEGRHQAALQAVTQWETAIGAIASHVLRAHQARRSGASNDAESAIKAAAALLTPDIELPLRRVIAEELTTQKLWHEALEVWKELVRPNCISTHTRALLQCAFYAKDDAYLLEFCSALRRLGLFDADIFHLEINKLLEYSAVNAITEAIKGYLSSAGEDELAKELRARLAHLALTTGRSDLLCFDLDELPSVDNVEPDLGSIVVILLSRGPRPLEAVEYAYKLLRRHFHSSHAHKAMVFAILGRPRDLAIPTPGVVGLGSAVKYKEDVSGETKWHIVEDDTKPDNSRDEYAPEHFRSGQLMGKRCGDSFYIRKDHIQEKTGTILEVWSKYKFRFNRSMEEWDTRFPNDPFLWKFSFGKKDDGTTDFTSLFSMMDKRDENIRQMERSYRDNTLSVTNFAMMTDVTVLEALQHLAASEDLPIRYCSGSQDEWDAAERSFDGSQTLIIDGAALSTLFMLSGEAELNLHGLNVAVSRGTLLELRELLLQRRDFQGTMFAKRGEKYAITEESEAVLTKRIEVLDRFVQSVEKRCTVLDGVALAKLPVETRAKFLHVVGRPAAETIALAKEQGLVLWSDDIVVAVAAQSELGVPRVWTDFVFALLVKQGKLPERARHECLASLTGSNYIFTRLTQEAVLLACRTANWDADEHRLKQTLRWFSIPEIRSKVVFAVSGVVLRRVWREAPSPFRADIVIQRILGQIVARTDAKRILTTLYQKMDLICGVDVDAADKLKIAIAVMVPRA